MSGHVVRTTIVLAIARGCHALLVSSAINNDFVALCRSSSSRTNLDSDGSLELASNMAAAQLGTVPEDPASRADSRTPCEGFPSAGSDGSSAELRQSWGRSMSPIAQQASHAELPASSHPAHSAEPAADTSRSLMESAVSRSLDVDTQDCDPRAHSASRLAAAFQEAEACRTRSDDDEHHAPETLMCSTKLLRVEEQPTQSIQNRRSGHNRQSSTEQRLPDSLPMALASACTEPKAVTDCWTSKESPSAGNEASDPSEARVHRRRTRQITVQTDKENLVAIQASMLEGTLPPVQKPLRSRTNLLSRRATGLQTDCDAGQDDLLLRAAWHKIPSGYKADSIMTREEAYRPLSTQLTHACTELVSSTRKSTQAVSAARGAASRRAIDREPRKERKAEQEASSAARQGLYAQGQHRAVPAPTYMHSTVSMRAKADIAAEQVRACKAAQQDRRRWSN